MTDLEDAVQVRRPNLASTLAEIGSLTTPQSEVVVVAEGHPPGPLRPELLEGRRLKGCGADHRRFTAAAGSHDPQAERDDDEAPEETARPKDPRREADDQDTGEGTEDLEERRHQSGEFAHREAPRFRPQQGPEPSDTGRCRADISNNRQARHWTFLATTPPPD